jgi:hypothetical protein
MPTYIGVRSVPNVKELKCPQESWPCALQGLKSLNKGMEICLLIGVRSIPNVKELKVSIRILALCLTTRKVLKERDKNMPTYRSKIHPKCD